jgi:hypothetical protein
MRYTPLIIDFCSDILAVGVVIVMIYKYLLELRGIVY